MLGVRDTDTENPILIQVVHCCVKDIQIIIAWGDTSIIAVRVDCHKNT